MRGGALALFGRKNIVFEYYDKILKQKLDYSQTSLF